MLNYGIDPLRYRRDLHEILYNTYRGLGTAEGSAVYGGWGEQFPGLFRRLGYWFKEAVPPKSGGRGKDRRRSKGP
jgi:hypothetical protein